MARSYSACQTKSVSFRVRSTRSQAIEEKVLDPDPHGPRGAKKGTDVGHCFARGSGANLGHHQVVVDAGFIRALVAQHSDFGDRQEYLVCRDCAGMTQSGQNLVDVAEVFPYETSYASVFGKGFVSPLRGLVAGRRPLHHGII
jgi:hypothetical protein